MKQPDFNGYYSVLVKLIALQIILPYLLIVVQVSFVLTSTYKNLVHVWVYWVHARYPHGY